MKRLLCLLTALAIAAPATAQKITLPQEVRGFANEYVQITAETDCPVLEWFSCDAKLRVVPAHLLKDSKIAIVSGPPGRYTLYAYGAKDSVPTKRVACAVVIGPDPTPPEPTPDPKPPKPPTPPDPVPPTPTQLRVLISFETSKQNDTPVIFSQKVRDYLNAHCTQGEKNRDWRIWDPDVVDASTLPPFWTTFLKRKRDSLPWILIADPKNNVMYEGPLPKTADAIVELLKKYGG